MSTVSPTRANNLVKRAQSGYIAETRGLDEGAHLCDDVSDNSSHVSHTRADLTILGIDLDGETISRLETNLGVALFNTASKAAQTLRVCSTMRSKAKEGQTPMGHLLDESYMNMKFLGNDITDISMVTAPKEKSSSSGASPAVALPKSITMSESFHENEEHFLPLASSADLESIGSTDRKLFDDDEIVPFEESEPNTPPTEAAMAVDSSVNNSLDYYRKKRSIFKTDLNELLGSDDEGEEEHKNEGAQHSYLDLVNVGAAYSIEPEVRSQLDKLLIALQIDFMKNPDKFLRRLFGIPLNVPKVNMTEVNRLRYVGESGFFEALRRVLRGYYGSGDDLAQSGGADYKKRMENELIFSLYQLVVERVKPRGEKERRPVVDLWKFMRRFRTGDRLRGEGRAMTKEEVEDWRIRSGFHKYLKTEDPVPANAHRVNALEREVASKNKEIAGERKDSKTLAWRNRSPPRHQFSTEGQSLYDSVFLPRPPRKESMLQVLNYDVDEKSRCPIDDDYHTRRATDMDANFHSSSHLMASRLTQSSGDNASKGHVKPRRAHRRDDSAARPWEERLGAVLHRHDFAKSEHGYIEKNELRKRRNNAFNSTSVAEALSGTVDNKMLSVHRKGAFFSKKAVSEANKSGESDKLRKSVSEQGVSRVSNTVDQEKKYLHNVKEESVTRTGEMPVLLGQQ